MGNPFCHIELHTPDVAKAKKFYKALFDWKLEDMKMPGATYTMIGVGKGTGGGMMTKPMPEAPTQWLPYIEVDDVKKSVAKAKKAGAQVIVEYMPIGPNGENGAFGIFIDPTGAGCGVWQGPKKKPAAKKAAKKGKRK